MPCDVPGVVINPSTIAPMTRPAKPGTALLSPT